MTDHAAALERLAETVAAYRRDSLRVGAAAIRERDELRTLLQDELARRKALGAEVASLQERLAEARKGEAEARMMFAAALHVAGGEIEIPHSVTLTLPLSAEILRHDDDVRDSVRYVLRGIV